ncbi:DUF6153 family protein [Streptomyces sp. MB09-02B]|uniref:DUF6153 family protein n=1 Tax=Streptomyces sp. MB09-02B TaxID=3028667 RepID=UPI0029B68025|nr:DUF6153 family protein [Streptomyces sp. MB09-02B]MDX3639250.1 DUF6153 family protein [Streptomyces sp. MB09-02B]
MSRRPFRRTALPCARSRPAHPLLVAALALATFLLFCAGSPPGEEPERRAHPVSAGSAQERPVYERPVQERPVQGRSAEDRSDTARTRHVERDPCGHSPGEHDCHSPDPAAVLGQMPLPGADHTAAPWQPAPAPAAVAPDGGREPGRARPPDLHELQLLRV